MNAFEISELDVKQAVKNRLNIDLTLFDAERIFNRLDLERVSDRALFDGDLDEATERAHDEIIRQVNTRSLIK